MTAPGRKALLVDYGGVLTASLGNVFAGAEEAMGVPPGSVVKLLLTAYADADGQGFVHRFERGEISPTEFEAAIADALREAGHQPSGDGILRLTAKGLLPSEDIAMWDVVASARSQGVLTGMLSNSWGTTGYPMERLETTFDDLVISGEVGLRKPDPAIYLLAAERLDVAPAECAFVDDFVGNVEAAQALGMFGVVHTGDTVETAAALESFLGVSLR